VEEEVLETIPPSLNKMSSDINCTPNCTAAPIGELMNKENNHEIDLDDDALSVASGGSAVSPGSPKNSVTHEHTEVFIPFDGSY
jgi:hypothetical protein